MTVPSSDNVFAARRSGTHRRLRRHLREHEERDGGRRAGLQLERRERRVRVVPPKVAEELHAGPLPHGDARAVPKEEEEERNPQAGGALLWGRGRSFRRDSSGAQRAAVRAA